MTGIRIIALLMMASSLAACMTIPGARALEAGNYDQAIQEATAEIDRGGLRRTNQAGLHQIRAAAYLFKQDYDLALNDLNRAVELYPSSDTAYSNIGIVYLATDRYKQAIEQFDQAIEINRVNAIYYVNRGIAHRFDRQYERAVADFSEALRREPRNINAYRGRAFAYALQKQTDQALSDAEAIVRLAPEDGQSY